MDSDEEWNDFLSNRAKYLDDDIVKSLAPIDNWVGHVCVGEISKQPNWWNKREIVRRLSEGLAYKRSAQVVSEIQKVFDQFEKVYPDLNCPWERTVKDEL